MRHIILVMIIVSLTACSTSTSQPTTNENNSTPDEDISYIAEDRQLILHDRMTSSSLENNDNIKDFKEYDTIDDIIQLQNHFIEIIEDSVNKRILLIKDTNKQEMYKTIYTKKNHRLKIIQIEKGQIFNKKVS